MKFGLNFFPCLAPEQKSSAQHYAEILHLTGICDELGYTHVREVEHYFKPYGGYSPSPIVLLSAASQRSRNVRLVTGAVLPAFNHPLKLAGEIGMLDGISNGRLDVGFGRAFLPYEFEQFGVSLDESRRRFTEGLAQVKLLLEGENVSSAGEFHSFKNVTSLPRPIQKPCPPIWIACTTTPQSFEDAGRNGFSIMSIPLEPKRMTELVGLYRESWRSAGHPGNGRVMNTFFMCCLPTRDDAITLARQHIVGHLQGLISSASGWINGTASTKDYPGYDKMIDALKKETFEEQIDKGYAWVGTPKDIIDMIRTYHKNVGGFEVASLHILPSTMPVDVAERSLRLFSETVMPQVAAL
jgi:alkanesulfonate monooxygenase SsuD/methylene tetrahydromethanopterin reductase-like flavin-dependent oxidoreductase (luciferase family)